MTDITQVNEGVGAQAPITRADRVAAAHQYTLDLETKVLSQADTIRDLQTQLGIANGRTSDLTAQLETLRVEADYYRSRCVEITTQLNTAARTILDALRDPRDAIAQYAPSAADQRRLEQSIRGAATTLHAPDDKEAPKFLKRKDEDAP